MDANEIGIGTDHSTSISGSSPCLAINNKTKEASINLEDKKTALRYHFYRLMLSVVMVGTKAPCAFVLRFCYPLNTASRSFSELVE